MAGFLKRNKNKIFFRVLILNFVVLTCLVFIYQIVSYLYFNKNYKEKMTDVFTYNASQTKHLIDNAIFKTQFEILNTYFNVAVLPSVSFNKFLSAGKISAEEIIQVKASMGKLLYLYPQIENIKIYSPANDLLFTNGYVTYLKDTAALQSAGAQVQIFQELLKNGKRQAWHYNEETRMVSFLQALPYYSFNNTVHSIISFDTSIDSFLNVMDESLSFTLLSENGTKLYGAQEIEAQQYGDIVAQMQTAEQTQRVMRSNIHGQAVVQMVAKSDYTGLYYLFGMQEDSLTSNFILSALGMFFLNIALLCVFLVISYVLARQLHKPLERIITAAKGATKNQGLLGDDYNLLDRTVEDVHLLRNKIDSNSGIIYETMVRSLLDGTFNGTQFAENYGTSGIRFDYDNVFAVIIKLFGESVAQAAALTQQLLGGGRDYSLYPVYMASRQEIYALVNTAHSDAEAVTAQLQQLLSVQKTLQFNVFAGNVYELHEENVHLSRCEAQSIAEYCYIMENAATLCYNVFTNTNFTACAEHTSKLEFMEHALKNKNAQAAQERCLEYLASLKNFEFDITYIKKSVLDVILSIKNALAQAAAVQCNEVVSLSARSLQHNIGQLEQHLTDIVFPAIAQHFEATKDDVSLESQLMRIINEAPYESITLDYIASKLNMRSSAFSKAFKSITNTNFIDYVKNMKLEYAVTLLCENKLSVKDVSAKLGYNTPHYFIKIFKERYTCTPKQYQTMRIAENLRQQNDSNAQSHEAAL